MSPFSKEQVEWDRHHNTGAYVSQGPAKELFTDNDPATTIKGCGFKNAHVAELTIKLAEQPGCRYKTYWTIRAMRERAARHPHVNGSMRDAIKVFDNWLGRREAGRIQEPSAEDLCLEREQRELLAKSFANAHARRNCKSDEEFAHFTKKDKTDSLNIVRDAAAKFLCNGSSATQFAFKGTSFVSLFGGPGEHGYGSHICRQADANRLPTFRCVCGYRGVHRIDVTQYGARDLLQLGARFPFDTFSLEWDGNAEAGRLLSGCGVKAIGAKKSAFSFGSSSQQTSLLTFMMKRGQQNSGTGDVSDVKRKRQ